MPREDVITWTGKIDSNSFEMLYRLYWKKVFALCLSHTRDQELAKEFVQEIFKSLWERRDHLVLQGSIEHYLIRSAKHKVLEHLRNQTNRKRIMTEVIPDEEPHEETTAHHIAYDELLGRVHQIVDNLPGHCRQVYLFSREEGLNNKEIANRLGISIRTVEYHLTNALRTLRLHLSDQ